MTNKERITALEAQIKELETKLTKLDKSHQMGNSWGVTLAFIVVLGLIVYVWGTSVAEDAHLLKDMKTLHPFMMK